MITVALIKPFPIESKDILSIKQSLQPRCNTPIVFCGNEAIIEAFYNYKLAGKLQYLTIK